MSGTERRKQRRHEIELRVTIHKQDEKVSAAMINISKGGVGLITERKILPGEKVHITVNHIGGHAIDGTTRWEKHTSKEGRTIYRLGVEADQVLTPENLWKEALPEFPAMNRD